MSSHENLQSTAASSGVLPVQVVTTGCPATVIDHAKILCADNELVADLQGVRENSCSRRSWLLDARFVAPYFQETAR
jgi:hypothetical protein